MNERIKELAKKLGPDPVGYIGNWGRVEWADNIYPQLGDRMYAAVDLEKFAELIIRDIHIYVDGLDTAQIISNGILKRYGVEQ
jgi:hypothetical protein